MPPGSFISRQEAIQGSSRKFWTVACLSPLPPETCLPGTPGRRCFKATPSRRRMVEALAATAVSHVRRRRTDQSAVRKLTEL